VHQHELGGGPADRLDRVLVDAALVVEQGHVREELRFDPPKAVALDRATERALECDQRGIVAAQYTRTRPTEKAHRAIEGHLEGRSHDARRGAARRRHQISRHARMRPEAEQRDVEARGAQRPAAEPMPDALLRGDGRQARGSLGLRKQRKEEAVGTRRREAKAGRFCAHRLYSKANLLV
jgi:hypothetical protein